MSVMTAKMACPPELTCPLTGMCMMDPVMAADGHTYERQAILAWMAQQRVSPRTRKLLSTKDLFPHHEKKLEIAVWRSGRTHRTVYTKTPAKPRLPVLPGKDSSIQDSSILQTSLVARLGKLTWASTPAQVLSELDQLSLFVKQNAIQLPRSRLGRLRSCLKADPALWSDKVEKSLERLEALGEPGARESSSSTSDPPRNRGNAGVEARAHLVHSQAGYTGGPSEMNPKPSQNSTGQIGSLECDASLETLLQDLPDGWDTPQSDSRENIEILGRKRGIEALDDDTSVEDEAQLKACRLDPSAFCIESLLSFD